MPGKKKGKEGATMGGSPCVGKRPRSRPRGSKRVKNNKRRPLENFEKGSGGAKGRRSIKSQT